MQLLFQMGWFQVSRSNVILSSPFDLHLWKNSPHTTVVSLTFKTWDCPLEEQPLLVSFPQYHSQDVIFCQGNPLNFSSSNIVFLVKIHHLNCISLLEFSGLPVLYFLTCSSFKLNRHILFLLIEYDTIVSYIKAAHRGLVGFILFSKCQFYFPHSLSQFISCPNSHNCPMLPVCQLHCLLMIAGWPSHQVSAANYSREFLNQSVTTTL